jgi:hypothetical protein
MYDITETDALSTVVEILAPNNSASKPVRCVAARRARMLPRSAMARDPLPCDACWTHASSPRLELKWRKAATLAVENAPSNDNAAESTAAPRKRSATPRAAGRPTSVPGTPESCHVVSEALSTVRVAGSVDDDHKRLRLDDVARPLPADVAAKASQSPIAAASLGATAGHVSPESRPPDSAVSTVTATSAAGAAGGTGAQLTTTSVHTDALRSLPTTDDASPGVPSPVDVDTHEGQAKADGLESCDAVPSQPKEGPRPTESDKEDDPKVCMSVSVDTFAG